MRNVFKLDPGTRSWVLWNVALGTGFIGLLIWIVMVGDRGTLPFTLFFIGLIVVMVVGPNVTILNQRSLWPTGSWAP